MAMGTVHQDTELDRPAGELRQVHSSPVRRRRLPFSPWHLLLMPTALLFLLPLAQMILASFMTDADLHHFPPRFIPTALTTNGYEQLFQQSSMVRWLVNSTIVSSVAVVSHLFLCSLAGYGFARLKFRGRQIGFFLMVSTIMIPTQLLMIPTFVMFAKVGLIDTLGAAIVPWLASAFGVFLMRQFFLSLPAELEDAARIDGCSTFDVFWRIVLPLARPALATLTVFTLLGSWNDLVWPLIAISNESHYTVQLGLANFQGARRTDWALLMAGNVVATLPLLVAFLLAQRHFVATMSFSGLKS
jgi:multiple sugar transport system permease protein